MDNLKAVQIIEENEADEETVREAWQHLVDTHVVWALQGWYGRNAMRLIREGFIHPSDEDVLATYR